MSDAGVARSLVIVRHGRTAANARGLLLGREDVPLDDVGRVQAARLAAAIAGGRFGTVTDVVSSPLSRATETAAATASALGLDVQTDERLIELDYGTFEGVAVSEVPAETWHRWQSDVEFCPPRGESLAEVGRRVRECCEQWAFDHGAGERSSGRTAGTVVLVSHVSPIKAAVAWALGVGDAVAWRAHLDTASITRLAIRGDRPVLSLFNETAHLE